jgi:hypothetical protein
VRGRLLRSPALQADPDHGVGQVGSLAGIDHRRDPDEPVGDEPVDAVADRGLRHAQLTADGHVRTPSVLLELIDDAPVQHIEILGGDGGLAHVSTWPRDRSGSGGPAGEERSRLSRNMRVMRST